MCKGAVAYSFVRAFCSWVSNNKTVSVAFFFDQAKIVKAGISYAELLLQASDFLLSPLKSNSVTSKNK